MPCPHRCAHHACDACRAAGLHRLPRRRCKRDGQSRSAPRSPRLRRRARPGACPAQIPGKLALAFFGEPEAHLYPAQPRSARIRQVRQPERLPRGARGLRRVPHPDDRGGRTLDDGDRRLAVGWGRLQQRDFALQELPAGRGLYARGRAREDRDAGRPAGQADRKAEVARRTGRALPLADMAGDPARRRVPRVRARRAHDQLAVPRNRTAQSHRADPAAGRAGTPRSQAVEPRPGDRAARGDPRAQHTQDPPQRSVHVVHGHQ